jgi:hypothetical protein
VLDLTNQSGITPAALMNQWTTASPDTSSAIYGNRMAPQAIAIDDYRFLINGGQTAPGATINQTIVYNAQTNKFWVRSAYSESPYGARQM